MERLFTRLRLEHHQAAISEQEVDGLLDVIAVLPTLIATYFLGNDSNAYMITQFLGGTGLLIVISVMLDFMNRIEANLVMRNYSGFLDDEGEGPARIKRPKGGGPRSPTQPQAAYDADNPQGMPA